MTRTIPITVHPLFWAVAALLGWTFSQDVSLTAIWVGIIFFSVLIHEFGHALTARFFGQSSSIELVAFGGLTTRTGKKLKLWQDFVVVFNGPLAGFCLFFLLRVILKMMPQDANPYLRYAVVNAAGINLFWTMLNLLPIMPLDGGQLMTIILESLFGFRGVKISLFISCILGVLAGLFFFLTGNMLIGTVLLVVAYDSFRGWRSTLPMVEKDRDEDLQMVLREANRRLEEGHTVEAQAILEQLRSKVGSGLLYNVATELLARIFAEQHHYEQAYQLLQPIRASLSEQGLRLLHHLAYRTARWKEAIRLGLDSYQNVPSVDTAILNGLCHASLGEVDASLGWLERAQEEGATDMTIILSHKELDPIRNDPRFQQFEKDLKKA